jgi:hypothetical protein
MVLEGVQELYEVQILLLVDVMQGHTLNLRGHIFYHLHVLFSKGIQKHGEVATLDHIVLFRRIQHLK